MLMFRFISRHAAPALAVFTLACSSAGLSAQATPPTPANAQVRAPGGAPRTAESRDDWQRVPDILAALGATRGSRIADLGAGEGWLTTRIARHVGPEGRVFAVDISETSLTNLAARLTTDSLRNVELILGEADDPRLPFGTLDGVVILNAYHEMPQRIALLDAIKRALRPGGVLVIVDNAPADSVTVRLRQMEHHSLGIEFADDDLQASGFEVVRREPTFIVQSHGEHAHDQWLLVARRVRK
jgi:SAM-dependent methyltransferase